MSVRPIQPRPPRTGQVAVGTSPLCVVGANMSRESLSITNLGPATVYLGYDNTVDVNRGFGLPSGTTLNTDHPAAMYVVAVATGSTVSFLEESR